MLKFNLNNDWSAADPLSEQWIDLRLVSTMRLMMASAALLVILIDPPDSDRYLTFTYTTLALYTIYSGAILLLSIRRSDLIPARHMHWFDMIWYLCLIAFSNGTSSMFFGFVFFAILVASFGWGYTAGLQLTVVSTILSMLVGILSAPQGPGLELNRLLLRPVQLLILGYLISRWGGFKINLRNRLQLLKEITVLSNPRFGIDRTVNAILESLRSFYDADSALLLVPLEKNKESYQLYRVRRGTHSAAQPPPVISADAAALFLLPFPNHAVIHRKDGPGQTLLFDVATRSFVSGDGIVSGRVASALETTNYMSVPVHNRQEPMGRLYVCGSPNRFDNMAMDFVLQLLDHITPLMENVRLVDNLASDAAEQERHRIARDIHDSVIQPYVGLQLGIAALAQKLRTGNTNVVSNVEELLELTNQELVEMRSYVRGLQVAEDRRDVLLPAINRFVTRFASVTGIQVDVKTHGKVEVNDRLAAEIFQIVAEGLSNVRRHALCNEAGVEIACDAGKLMLQIKNRRPGRTGDLNPNGADNHNEQTLFTPRSIAERAALLGGETKVSIDENNYTVVNVAIPL
ncbi:MAG TPA: histidine kinase [Pyrinomonadaceae bacterium]|nr:histidine kinase [Pyrinomonadaceae bacterium]